MSDKVTIGCLTTGVPGLDAILGGGLPEFSFFDLSKVGPAIRMVNLSEKVAAGDFDQALARITAEVKTFSPALVFIDSFQAPTAEASAPAQGALSLPQFIQRLGVELSGWQATTFLLGEYSQGGASHPVVTVADGLISLEQGTHLRFMVIVKANKQSEAGGLPDEKMIVSMGKFNDELIKAGALLAMEGLHPSSKAARIQFSGDKRTVVDGPFAESKELIAGFWLVQMKSREEATEWFKRAPFQSGALELRQVHEEGDFGG